MKYAVVRTDRQDKTRHSDLTKSTKIVCSSFIQTTENPEQAYFIDIIEV